MTSWQSHVAGNRRQIHQWTNIDSGPRQNQRQKARYKRQRTRDENHKKMNPRRHWVAINVSQNALSMLGRQYGGRERGTIWRERLQCRLL